MKNVTLVFAIILFLSCVTSKVTATELESSTNQELFLSRHLPRFHPKPHWPFRGPRPAGHFRPTPFHLPQEVTRCLSDKEEVGTCFDDIAETFITRKAAIGSECCAAIMKMNKDCEKTVFGSFHNPFLTGYVKLHCSTVVGSTSPTSSSAPSQAPIHAPSHAPSQAPSHVPLHAPIHAPSPAPLHAPLQAPSQASSPAHAPLHAPLHAPSPAPLQASSPAHAPLHAPSPAPLHAPLHAPSQASSPAHAPLHAPLHAPSPAPLQASSPAHAPLHAPSPAPLHAPLHAPLQASSPAQGF
ncbi:hypothetical protein Bca52824_036781 [Brassica carinata]|uniref:Prolamin-like domain-containing protein n=1 Tax=Brassica carinata TaxID=52824 RepID=A0A8X7SA48_BRACI|nr:hypothetical protein Bca52824_036781 [Brassica carinata]